METHLTEALESPTTPSDSVHFQQTLGVSSPNSPPTPPPTQTLDDLGASSLVPDEINLVSSSNIDNLSPPRDETPDLECQEDDGVGDDPSHSSPMDTISAYTSSDWAEPCTSARDTKPEDSEPCPLAGDTIINSSASHYSELWPLAEDTNKSMVGAGLANLGNTCFLNAVLQCFTHTVPLVLGLRSCNHVMPCDSYDSDGFCVLCSLRDHIEVSLASAGRVVSPRKLVDNLSYFSSSFQRFQQEDAHEFLQCLLDRLDSCCNDSKMRDMTLPLPDDNFVKQGFGGRLVSKLSCCNCGHCSDTYEPLIDLSLEIEDVGTLVSALESFTKVEKIEDPEAKFTCENCKEEVSVEKQLMLEQTPSVAAFHLKRFKNDGSYVEKIDKYVEFPLELDLLPYSSGSQNKDVDLKYDLYAVVVHTGFSSTSGHYYCFIRSAPDTWYKFDDSKVIRVREDFVLSQEAYILFYAKQGTPWFSSFMKTQKPSLYPNISNTSPKSVLDNVDDICTMSPSVANNASVAPDGISTGSTNLSREVEVEPCEAKNDSQRIYSPVPLGASKKIFSPSVKVIDSKQELSEAINNANITPRTPPRSPSPDIYEEEEEPPEVVFSISRNHQRLVDQVSCKRQLKTYMEEDPERKEAHKIMKTMPGSRREQLLAAMKGPHNEDSLNKKRRRRMEPSLNRDDSPSSGRQKPNLGMRVLAAGISH